VLWFAVGGLALGLVYGAVGVHGAVGRHEVSGFVATALGCGILFAGITAIIVAISKASSLVVDGTEVVHRQVGRSQRVSVVGAGWRLISYRSGFGKTQRYIRVLFSPNDHPLMMFNGSMWSSGLFTDALGPLGVKVMDQHDAVRPSTIDSMTPEQIGALSDEEAARLMKATEDKTVPPMPRRVVRN
jgi:hypothetical protein